MRRVITRLVFAGLGLGLSACSVGPHYHATRQPTPANWAEHPATPQDIRRTNHEMKDWWRQFHDPVLSRVVEKALEESYDLKKASADIMAYQALCDQYAAQWYPQMNAAFENGYHRINSTVTSNVSRAGRNMDTRALLFSYGINATWQADVFGRIARQVEAQKDVIGQGIEARRAVVVSLLSQLALAYVSLRELQARLHIAHEQAGVAGHILDIAQRRFRMGEGDNLQVAQAEAQLATRRAAIGPLKTGIAKVIHTMEVLSGQLPGSFGPLLEPPRPMPRPPARAATLPSIVLMNRPDVRQAERRYAEATARIGLAVANLYPNFVMPGVLSQQARSVAYLGTAASFAWNAVFDSSIPVFHGGKLTAAVHEAEAEAEAARLSYRQTVLEALKDVQDNLAAWDNDQNYEQLIKRSAAYSRDSSRQALALYDAGLSDLANVLQTQQAALEAQNAAVKAQAQRLNDAIRLYTAIGAGWHASAVARTDLPVSLEQQNALARMFSQ